MKAAGAPLPSTLPSASHTVIRYIRSRVQRTGQGYDSRRHEKRKMKKRKEARSWLPSASQGPVKCRDASLLPCRPRRRHVV
jgi:hypothetical protein